MCRKLCIILLAYVTGFSTAAFGEPPSYTPDVSVFNKVAGHSPAYVFWSHKAWTCASYNENDRDCLEVEELDNAYMAATTTAVEEQTASDDAPCTCVFDRTRMWVPETFSWKDRVWKCSSYDDDGIYCTGVVEIKE
jgi:hypothetical protein